MCTSSIGMFPMALYILSPLILLISTSDVTFIILVFLTVTADDVAVDINEEHPVMQGL